MKKPIKWFLISSLTVVMVRVILKFSLKYQIRKMRSIKLWLQLLTVLQNHECNRSFNLIHVNDIQHIEIVL